MKKTIKKGFKRLTKKQDERIKTLPAIHRRWIKEEKMTQEESDRIVREWEIRNKIKEMTGETIEDMGLLEEIEEEEL